MWGALVSILSSYGVTPNLSEDDRLAIAHPRWTLAPLTTARWIFSLFPLWTSSHTLGAGEGGEALTPRSLDGPEVSQQVAHLLGAVQTVEQRLLCLVREEAQGMVSQERSEHEFAHLGEELKRCYRWAVDIKDRRDLGFAVTAKLRGIREQCVWLYRRMRLEEFFLRKWQLETRLRSLVCKEAFDVYQEILNLEDVERQLLIKSDSEIDGLLLDEPHVLP